MLGWLLLTTPRERLRAGLRLVAELHVVPAPTLFALLAIQVLRAATVPVSAWASGLVVAQVIGSAPVGVAVAVTVFGLGLWLGETVGHVMWLLLAHVARIVDGRLRSEVRLLLGRATTLDIVDDPQLRDDVNHVLTTGGARGYEKSLGVAAAAQVAMWFNVLEVVLVALVLTGVSWWFALTAFAAMLIVRAVSQRSWDTEAAGETDDARGQRQAAYWTDLGTGAAAAKEVRVFGMGQWVADRRRAATESYLVPRWARHRAVFRSLGVVGALAALAAVWIVGWPVVTVARGAGSQADLARWLVAALGLLFLISRAHLGYSVAYGHVVLAAAERVRQRLGHLADPTAARVSGVVARGVQFGYGTGPPVLHSLDLRIEPGEVIAVVGPNGAGKTTLMRLLAQLDAPTDGSLIGPERDQVAVLFSEFARYPLPLRDNVSLGSPLSSVDDVAVLEALSLAGADDVAAQVGLDTPLSPAFAGGVDLSGGQWQKVALARMVFAARHGRRLLIMDEPTAHLDAEQEADFYDRVVRTLSGPETMIVLVSHRLSTVRAADRILLLDGGRIAEQGNHTELLAADGAYATMFRLQAGRFTSGQSR